jgi:hypothetical protein
MSKNKPYLNNEELYYEIIVSKSRGILTRKAKKMIELIATEAMKKMGSRYWNPEDKSDCYQSALMYMFQNWYNFNEDKGVNAFAYFTEIFKRGIAFMWNTLYKKKGDPDHKIKLLSLEGSNDGQGLHSI